MSDSDTDKLSATTTGLANTVRDHLRQRIQQWMEESEDHHSLGDSNSEVVSRTHSRTGSSTSRKSSVSRTRARLAAQRAALEAEQASFKERHILEQEEFLLLQKREALELKVKLAKTQAQENVYMCSAESESPQGYHVSFPESPNYPRLSTTEVPVINSNAQTTRSNVCEKTESRAAQSSLMHTHVKTVATGDNLGPLEIQVHKPPSYQQLANRPMHDIIQLPNESHNCDNKNNSSELNQINSDVSVNASCPQTSVGDQYVMHAPNHDNIARQNTDTTFTEAVLEAIQLPRAELMTFDGDPIKYWLFIRAFETTVDKESISDSAKLVRLMQYCTGKARRVIQCCSVCEPSEGYAKARRLLRERFGNEYTIAEAWIEKITCRPMIKQNDKSSLQDMADELCTCVETLKTMGKLGELNNMRSLASIIEKLPTYLRSRWLKEVYNIKTKECRQPNIKDVLNFVVMSAAEASDPVFGLFSSSDRSDSRLHRDSARPKDHKQRRQGSSFAAQAQLDNKVSTGGATSTTDKSCVYCGAAHSLFGCDRFKSLKPIDRLTFTRSKRLCDNCLLGGHYSFQCEKNSTCTVPGCSMKHTKFLHIPRVNGNFKTNTPTAKEQQKFVDMTNKVEYPTKANAEGTTNTKTTCGLTGAGAVKVALPVVSVKVRGQDGCYVSVNALLDSGSTHTFCSEELLRMIGVPGSKTHMSLTTLEKENSSTDTWLVSLEIMDIEEEYLINLPHVFTRPSIPIHPENFARQEDIAKWPHLCDINLPVVGTNRVHLLIGQDVPEVMIPKEVIEGASGEPFATRSVLGWALNGPIGDTTTPNVTSHYITADTDLQRQVERFWQLENTGAEGKGFSVNDNKVLAVYEGSCKMVDGHYCMDIPFKYRPPCLPDDKSMAEHRLQLLGRRLNKDPALKQNYVSGIHELIDKGFAELVPEEESEGPLGATWYIPHHPVMNPKKPDKTRIVFDCAAKCKGTALNDNVYQGPDLTNELIGVLQRFRQEPVALMSDIESMFHQVKVTPKDRNVLRFLWWNNDDDSKDPQTYRMTSHLFGGVWSPSSANFALKRTAKDNRQSYSVEAIRTVEHNFYVDDCLKSVESDSKAIKLVGELCDLLSKGGFHLTKWVSNSRAVLKSIPESERAKDVKSLDLDNEHLPVERALGVLWDIENDTFKFKNTLKDKPHTRRGVLSVVSSIYDPCGFISPFILIAKMLLQELCRQKLGWDEVMSSQELDQWQQWLSDVPLLENFSLPRCVKPSSFGPVVLYELHHFSDASGRGFGSVTYLRMVNSENEIHCGLLMSKAKLVPMKATTIPRLELSAGVVSVWLDTYLRQQMDFPISESYFWTDSIIVLQYIMNHDKRFHTFVANRVATIHQASQPSQWRYVESKVNPADDVSRGMVAQDLINSERWVRGPEFLWHSQDKWPDQPDIINSISEDDSEIKCKPQIYVMQACGKPEDDPVNRLFRYYSSWYRLKRAVAWILRAKQLLLLRAAVKQISTSITASDMLTVKEIRHAEMVIVKNIQTACFTDTHKKTSPVRRLLPMMSGEGMLCVGGRLGNADLSNRARHQWLLPHHHPVVELIIRHYHEGTGHSGVEHVLSEVRQNFWIVKGRAAVKKVVNSCFDCRRRNSMPDPQQMASLPEDRVTPGKPPFTNVGIDYFGPLIVKCGRSEKKRYGCLFTCLVTRAIHIEVAFSLETDSFINAMQRFTSRRGNPELMRSDNGTNLVGGEKEMRLAIRSWNMNQIEEHLKQKEIKWVFNPPAASHMGGVWERLIRSVRKILNSLMKEQALDDEGLATLMCRVEAILNGRPITKLSSDPRDMEPLTPNHLLLLRGGPTLPPGQFVKQDLYGKRWRQVQHLANVFWRRWIREYLPSLQERSKWLDPKRNLQVGDIVLVKDENTPRNSWPLARVTETHPGKDGLIRSVQIQTRSAVLSRPVDKLCLLEGVC